ncbi:hypothetical protein NQ315_010548 [Exocentrus adspersus]|uniref:DDRGK domain-containing protein 1 n=1 Tax=Exocentrus adspersus TaxID=1586481 RepID=A0AAV8W568_9CUCU|nr:hypothetical protein NQ315_010548 [Exocentrus adspersus]
MDIILLAVIAAVILIVLIGVTFVFKGNKQTNVPERPRPVPNRIRDGAPRRAQVARNRGARMRANVVHQDIQEPEENELDKEEAEPTDNKLGAKKRAKLEAKAEKKAAREAEEQLRTEKRKKAELAEEERKIAEEKEKHEEKRREEEERRAKEEKEQREYEEYLKMKQAFSVEEEGFEEEVSGDQQNLLEEFVNYIKTNKVVVIEDLAARFKLKTQAAIDRIRDLQNDGILTGVIDDRGKFIYVSLQEMEAVVKYIRQRGRVSIAELAENSNTLINLSPSAVVN